MKRFLLFPILIIFSCNTSADVNNELDTSNNKKAPNYIIDTISSINISNPIDSIDVRELYGTWVEKLLWIKADAVWKGLRPIGHFAEYIFNPDSSFILNEYTADSLISSEKTNYWPDKDPSCLILFDKTVAKKLKHGDSTFVQLKHIHLVNDTILRIGDPVSSGSNDQQMIKELRRTK